MDITTKYSINISIERYRRNLPIIWLWSTVDVKRNSNMHNYRYRVTCNYASQGWQKRGFYLNDILWCIIRGNFQAVHHSGLKIPNLTKSVLIQGNWISSQFSIRVSSRTIISIKNSFYDTIHLNNTIESFILTEPWKTCSIVLSVISRKFHSFT